VFEFNGKIAWYYNVLEGMTNGNIDMAVTFIPEQYICVTQKALKGNSKDVVVQERSRVIAWDGM